MSLPFENNSVPRLHSTPPLGSAPPSSGVLPEISGGMLHSLSGGNGVLLLLVAAMLIGMNWLGKGGQGARLARSFLGGDPEKRAARRKALSQMQARRHNAVTLFVGSPSRNKRGEGMRRSATLWLPDAQRGIVVVGAPGSGKTFSVINPVIRSALDQGFPTIVYDFKYPDQTELLCAYAAKRGYRVKIFAPAFAESEVCNPLDFLRDSDDALMARQIATVMNRNFALNANSSEDKFFSDAGDQLTQAILMLAKAMPEPDLMMASTLLSLADLPKRLEAAYKRSESGNGWKMSNWVYLAFSQLLQLQGSEKTVAGVIGTASKIFSRFLSPELVSAFCGQTTLPLDLEGKTLLILGLDRQRREAVAPLIATILHMIVTRNVTRRRKDPLVLALDELPTLYLPYLTNWLNENRSDGLVTMIGFQNLNQLEKTYSREISRAILGGCATKVVFNPQEHESARAFSEYLGEEEIGTQQRSRSRGKGGSSTSTSDQLHKRSLVEAAQFNKFPTGKCVFVNPAYQRHDEGSIPLILTIKVPAQDLQEEDWSRRRWDQVRQRLIANSHQVFNSDEQSKAEIDRRMAIAQQMFPLAEEESSAASPLRQDSATAPKSLLAQLQDVF
ncbi:MAG TPA: type IV secretion system DNA-binding domain-containing protein [Chroococcidiopsis sp.]